MASWARSASWAWVSPCRSRSSRTTSPSFFPFGLTDRSHQVRRLDVPRGEEAAELLERADLDLADSLAGEPEPLADALQGEGLLTTQAETQRDHCALPVGQVLQHAGQVGTRAEHGRQPGAGLPARVRDALAEAALAVARGRLVERDRMLAQALQLLELGHRAPHLSGHFRGRRRPPELLGERVAMAVELAQQRLDVHGQADRAGLIGERAHHRLTDPPGRVRREAGAAVWVELSGRVEEAHVALLDEIEEREAPVQVPPRDLDHESQVRLDELPLGLRVPGLDPPCQRLLFLCGEQLDPRDLL